jgi:hypothetical protein
MKNLAIVLVIALGLSVAILMPSTAQAPQPLAKQLKALQIPTKQLAKSYAKSQLEFRGYSKQDWTCLNILWTKESNWNHKADNKSSSAFGIAQVLKETSTDYVKQINVGLRYIESRYGNACNAWNFWLRNYYY